jgi:hypothetical protein
MKPVNNVALILQHDMSLYPNPFEGESVIRSYNNPYNLCTEKFTSVLDLEEKLGDYRQTEEWTKIKK